LRQGGEEDACRFGIGSDPRRKVRWTGDDDVDPVDWKDGMLGDGIMAFPVDTTRGEYGCF
jgi:hypothetical protein